MEPSIRRFVSVVFGPSSCVAPQFCRRSASPICKRQFSISSSTHAAKGSKLPAKQIKPSPNARKTSRRSPPTIPPPPRSNPLKNRTIPILFGGITLFLFSTYCTYAYVQISRAVSDTPSPGTPDSQFDVSSRYDDIAPTFDSSVDWTESVMGIRRMRKKLAEQARGDVLEVAVGTGRNLEYYEWDFKGIDGGKGKGKKGRVRSFTAVDKSSEMLEVAHEKFSKLYPGILGVRWIIADAGKERTIPGPPRNANERSGLIENGKYDTVIETMGLCSVNDPVGYLRNLGEVVKEDEGKILLLEHGRGKWLWLNKLLDKFAENHAQEFGCWWNRDLGRIVEESGLEVVEIKRPWSHGGTTWWIELKKPKSGSADAKDIEKKTTAGISG